MLIALVIVTAVVVSAPIVACLLVSVASKREDSAWSLGEHAPGSVQVAARRILDFHTDAPSSLGRTRGAGDPGLERLPRLRVAGRPIRRLDMPEPTAASKPAHLDIRTSALGRIERVALRFGRTVRVAFDEDRPVLSAH